MKTIAKTLHYCYAVLCALFIFSCSKTELSQAPTVENLSTIERKFFEEHRTADPTEKALINFLKRVNEKDKFVAETVEKIGYPRWDKIITKAKNNAGIYSRNGQDSIQKYYLPFVRDSQNYVNASMIIEVSATDTSLGYKCDWEYRLTQNNDNNAGDSAEYIAAFFMSLDNAVFGTRKFKVTDTSLFRNNNRIIQYIELDSIQHTSNNLLTYVEYCQDMALYFNDCQEAPGHCLGPNGTCDFCWECTSSIVWTYCWGEYVETGGSGNGGTEPGGNDGGGSGNGSGGGSTPPDCGTPQGRGIAARGDLPCEGGPGWEPEPIDEEPPSILEVLAVKLNLTSTELSWLHSNPAMAEEITDFLADAEGNENPLTNMPYFPSEDPRAIMAAKATLQTTISGLLTTGYNQSHFNILTSNLPAPANSTSYNPMYGVWFTITCVNLKLEHPEWSNTRVFLEASLEVLHMVLDGAGMVPVIGEVADITNGVIYTIQGDGVNATLSYAAAVPIAGWAATLTKYARKTILALDGSKRTLNWFKDAAGKISFGDRSLLRKVLGLAKGDARKAHHIIPWEHCGDELVQKAAGKDFNMNEILNGMPLTSIQHNGSHALYNQKIKSKLVDLWNTNGQNAMTPETAAALVRNLADTIRNWIISHPTESINNIIL